MENLERNTAHWRELCDSQQQDAIAPATSAAAVATTRQQQSSTRNDSIVEDVDENT